MDSAAATRAPPHLRGLGRLPAWLPGESPPPPDAVFSIGIFLIPYGQTALQPAASALKELKQSLRQHAMADVNQWTPPAVALGASFDSAGHANALPVAVSVTNFRVALMFPRHPHRAPLTVPLASIGEVAKGRSGGGVFWADLVCKTPLVLRIACDSEVRANNVAREIVVRVPRRVKDTFAYAAQQQQPQGLQRDVGWGIYNAEAELTRLAGRRADITLASLHDPCFATYPTTVMVPAAAAPELLTEVARYRQNARIPMISWADGSGTATLARCSQPLVGAGRRSRADEALLGLLVGFRFDQQQNAAANLSTSDVAAVSPPPPANNSSSTSVAAAAGAADDGSPTSRSAKLQAPMSPAVTPGPSRGSGDASSNRTSPAPTAATKATTRPPPSLFGNDSFATTALMQQAASANDVSELDGGAEGPRSRRGSGAAPATPPPQAPQQRTLHVVDCRSRAAAAANSAAGGGHELTAYYPRAVSHFLSLANIHKVAKSYLAVRAVCANAQAALSAVGWSTSRSQSEGFWPRLSQSEWPLMTVKLLCAANRVADLLTTGDSVVVHCTDGWDRTSQVTSLAMLLLDPYYRSVSGFCVLIEQEWLRAGHRFSDRCAADSSHHVDPHGGKMNALLHKLSTTFDLGSDSDPDAEDVEPVLDTGNSLPGPFSGSAQNQQDPTDARGIKPVASPVFIQFLDAVFQLLRQFPTAFEFTPAFLRLLAEECYGGRFGTFLGNTHRARHERQRHASATTAAPSRPSLPAYAATPSLWTFVAQRLVAERDAMRHAAPFCGGNGSQAAANSPWGWAESDPLADSGIIDRDGRQPLLNPLYEAPDETPDQRVVRQLGQFGFPHSVIHAAAAAAKEAADAARAAQQATVSQQQQQAPATPPPAQPLPPEDGTRVPLARAAERRLVPSFHTKRYNLWASLFLSGDFDAPSDLHPAGALAPSSASLAALEVPGAAPHVTAMAAAAAACRAGLTAGQAPATSAGGIGTADPTTAVLSVFPCAITDAEDFNRLNTVPPLPSPQVAGAAGVGESPGAEDGGAASPSPALGNQQQQPLPPLADVGASPGIVAPSPLLEGSQNVPGSALLLERGESQDAIFFIPREDAAVCYICEAGFNLWSRRHTCRMCARSVCGRCGGHYAVLARGQIALKEEKHLSGQKLRVCSNCVIKYRTTTMSAAGPGAAGSGAPGARRDPGDAPRAAQPREDRRDSGGGGADGAASDTPPEPALTPRSTAVFHAESPPNHLDSPPALAGGKPR